MNIKKYTLSLLFLTLVVNFANAQFGKALLLDGTNDFLQIPDNNYLDLNNSFTVEANFNQLKVEGVVNIINKGWCYGNDWSYGLAVVDGVIWWQWFPSGACPGSRYESVDTVISTATCYHISVVHNSTSVKFYLNGVEIPGHLVTGNYGLVHNSETEVRCGIYKNTDGSYCNNFWGLIDEIRIWNYNLSHAEINNYLLNPLSGNESGLIAYYSMEDIGTGQGVVVSNKATISGSALDGITVGTTTSPQFINSCIVVNSEMAELNNIDIYPNPTTGALTIDSENFSEADVYDIYGACLQKAVKSKTISLNQFPSGIYFIHLKTENQLVVKKVVKL